MSSRFDYDSFKAGIENTLGFKAYEAQHRDQTVWYGTSDKYEEFKIAVKGHIKTGEVVFLMDVGEQHMYSAFKDKWF